MRRHHERLATLACLLPLVLVGCAGGAGETTDAAPTASAETAPPARQLPDVVERMIEAHGGYDTWASAPTVSFRDALLFEGSPVPIVSRPVVEQGRRRIYTDFPGMQMRVAWDGQQAWSMNWAIPAPPRFFVSLNYYFANLPWLVADPGVTLTEEGTGTLRDDPTEYRQVRVTYGEGVGDSPDDYYVLMIHPETHQLAATRYVVTYSALLAEGQTSTPENTLVYDEWQTVDGLVVPKTYTIYTSDGAKYASCQFDEWSFSKPFDTAQLAMPAGAIVDNTMGGGEG